MIATAPAIRVLIPPDVQPDFDGLEGELMDFSGRCMGTRWSVRVVCAHAALAGQAEAGVALILETIEAQMSHFREHSALRRFARSMRGDWMELPPEFARVMQTALEIARASQGAFDPTLGDAVDAWGFGAARHFSDPDFVLPAQNTAPRRADWARLVLDERHRLLQPGGVSLNLSAIAKGFAVDAVSEYLCRLGLVNHLVEVGGELRGVGMKPDFQPWWVALEQPAADCSLPATRIALHGLAVATSGDYRRRYLAGGKHLQHTLDPATGAPVVHSLASVTVIHEECMRADAWATALMVLGPRSGLALAESLGLRALLQWKNDKDEWVELASTAFKALQQ